MSDELVMHCGDDAIADEIKMKLHNAVKGTTLKVAIRYKDAHPCVFIERKDKKELTKSDRTLLDAFKNGYNAALKTSKLYDDMDSGRRKPLLRS